MRRRQPLQSLMLSCRGGALAFSIFRPLRHNAYLIDARAFEIVHKARILRQRRAARGPGKRIASGLHSLFLRAIRENYFQPRLFVRFEWRAVCTHTCGRLPCSVVLNDGFTRRHPNSLSGFNGSCCFRIFRPQAPTLFTVRMHGTTLLFSQQRGRQAGALLCDGMVKVYWTSQSLAIGH